MTRHAHTILCSCLRLHAVSPISQWTKETTLEQRGQGTLAHICWAHTPFTFTPPRTYKAGQIKFLVYKQAAKASLALGPRGWVICYCFVTQGSHMVVLYFFQVVFYCSFIFYFFLLFPSCSCTTNVEMYNALRHLMACWDQLCYSLSFEEKVLQLLS